MNIGLFSGLSPAVGQQLPELAGLHRVDPGEHIGQVCHWIDLVLLARRQERQVDRSGLAAGVGAHEEAVFPLM